MDRSNLAVYPLPTSSGEADIGEERGGGEEATLKGERRIKKRQGM
jgi:hypothetical protein